MKPVPAYRQPCFLPTPPTPDGDIDLAAPEPATAASTPTATYFKDESELAQKNTVKAKVIAFLALARPSIKG